MKTDSSRRFWSFLALSGTLSALACGDTRVPPDVIAADPLVAAALQAGDGYCVPEAIFQDGLGGFNPLVSDPRFSTLDECGPPPTEDPYPDSAGIWIYGWEPNECFNISWDIDNDGVHNGCENAMAAAFAPEMIFTTRCDWDAALSRMGGEYYFAVQLAKTQVYGSLRIAYLPAYYWDCGGIHEVCQFPFVSCGGHPGDSEFILVDITYDFGTQHWETDQVFLSAHCGTGESYL
jgi:hypothetical protein